MPNADLPISHATHLVPYVRFLDRIGTPIESALEQMRLPAGLLHTPNCYVPTESLFGFVGKFARKEGIDDLGFQVAYTTGLGLLGPTLAAKVCDCPTLLQALQVFCRFVNKEASQFWAWIVEDEDEIRVYIHRTFQAGRSRVHANRMDRRDGPSSRPSNFSPGRAQSQAASLSERGARFRTARRRFSEIPNF